MNAIGWIRSPAPPILASAALLLAAACSDSPTSVSGDLGPVIAVDSLVAVDGAALPYRLADSAGARVTLVSGALTFRAQAHYTDTVFTPGGAMSAACVRAVPDGAAVHANGLVTLADGTAYLLVPCSRGTYALTVERELESGGVPQTALVTVSSGTFLSQPNALGLSEPLRLFLPVALARDTVTVTAAGHAYRFVAVRTY